jgi:hypothetical protein
MGSDYYSITQVTLDNSYAEGGETVSARELGLRRVIWATCDVLAGSESEEWLAFATYTPSTEKVHLFSSKTGKELVKEKDLSKVVVQVVAFGKP